MKVLKFGGTSVGSAQRIKNVASIICDQEQKIVVLSAMAGTTNSVHWHHPSDYLSVSIRKIREKPMRSFLLWNKLMSII